MKLFSRFLRSLAALLLVSILAGCGGGGDQQAAPPVKAFATAQLAAEAFVAAPQLLERSEYAGVANPDGSMWVTIRYGGRIVYDKLLGQSDFDYLTGSLADGTPVTWVTEYYPYAAPTEVVIVGGSKVVLPQMKAERDGTPRLVLILDIKSGAGDWLITYGEEILHAGDVGDPRQFWAALNWKTGEFQEFGDYAVLELLYPPEPEVTVPTTAQEAYQAYQEVPFIIAPVEDDPFVRLENGTYRAVINVDGYGVYERIVNAGYDYKVGATSDGTPLYLLWDSGYGVVIVGNHVFPLWFHAERDGQQRQIQVLDVSEGAGQEWLIVNGREISSEEVDRHYWALLNRHTGQLVELGYYDPSM